MALVENLVQYPNLREIIDELERTRRDEQQRRYQLWVNVDERVKAEFMPGAIICYSPIYGRPWMVSTQITRRLLPYVYDEKLGMARLSSKTFSASRLCCWSYLPQLTHDTFR